MIAAQSGDYAIVKELIKRNPETDHRDDIFSRTAEELARRNGHYAVTDMIRDNKAKLLAQDPLI